MARCSFVMRPAAPTRAPSRAPSVQCSGDGDWCNDSPPHHRTWHEICRAAEHIPSKLVCKCGELHQAAWPQHHWLPFNGLSVGSCWKTGWYFEIRTEQVNNNKQLGMRRHEINRTFCQLMLSCPLPVYLPTDFHNVWVNDFSRGYHWIKCLSIKMCFIFLYLLSCKWSFVSLQNIIRLDEPRAAQCSAKIITMTVTVQSWLQTVVRIL